MSFQDRAIFTLPMDMLCHEPNFFIFKFLSFWFNFKLKIEKKYYFEETLKLHYSQKSGENIFLQEIISF